MCEAAADRCLGPLGCAGVLVPNCLSAGQGVRCQHGDWVCPPLGMGMSGVPGSAGVQGRRASTSKQAEAKRCAEGHHSSY